MSLSCPPASPEAKSLVDDIIDIITKSEKRQRARKADEVPVFKSAVGLIIGDLLIGFHTREAGWSYLSMSTSAFSDRPVGYKAFKTIVETMEAAGLIKVSLGRNSKTSSLIRVTKLVTRPASPHDLSLRLYWSRWPKRHGSMVRLLRSIFLLNFQNKSLR